MPRRSQIFFAGKKNAKKGAYITAKRKNYQCTALFFAAFNGGERQMLLEVKEWVIDKEHMSAH